MLAVLVSYLAGKHATVATTQRLRPLHNLITPLTCILTHLCLIVLTRRCVRCCSIKNSKVLVA